MPSHNREIVAVQGLGKIGSTIVKLLAPRYDVRPAHVLDASALDGAFAVINAAPFFTSIDLAEKAVAKGVHYLDMTEDTAVTNVLRKWVTNSSLIIPQCGLAPGVISIIAAGIARGFKDVKSIKLRVGGLPVYPTNPPLNYALTWNIDGLINQYRNPAHVIRHGFPEQVPALADVEAFYFDGVRYEAFATSGGVGTLLEAFPSAESIDYKTVRYPGHARYMRTLLENFPADKVKEFLAQRVPETYQDIVIISVSVIGHDSEDVLRQYTYAKTIRGTWGRSAMQEATANSVCAVLELIDRSGVNMPRSGFVHQHQIPMAHFANTCYGEIFRSGVQ